MLLLSRLHQENAGDYWLCRWLNTVYGTPRVCNKNFTPANGR